ncbi:hypothetical protein [Azospirillum largimobile]
MDLPLQSVLLADLRRRGVPILDRYGRRRFPSQEPGFAYRITDDGGRQVAVRWCPLEPYPSDAWIANANAIYAAWHAGMRISGDLNLLSGSVPAQTDDHDRQTSWPSEIFMRLEQIDRHLNRGIPTSGHL